ncbi:MAG: YraN family protein [bacterium]
MSSKKIIGNYGEKLALKYLVKNGYNILETHFFGRFGEIDIIATKDGKIHFIEVKSRTTDFCGSPEEGMTATKIKRVFKTCSLYIYKKKLQTDNYQVDLIAIKIDKDSKKALIRHYKGIQ